MLQIGTQILTEEQSVLLSATWEPKIKVTDGAGGIKEVDNISRDEHIQNMIFDFLNNEIRNRVRINSESVIINEIAKVHLLKPTYKT